MNFCRPGSYARMVDYNREHDHKDRDLCPDNEDSPIAILDDEIEAAEMDHQEAIRMCQRRLAHESDENMQRILSNSTRKLLELKQKRRELVQGAARHRSAAAE